MPKLFCCKHIAFYRKTVSAVVVLCFSLFTVVGPAGSQIIPGQIIGLTAGFQPPVLRGMTVHPENPLLFDFIVDRGQDKIGNDLLKDESTKLIKYFLTSMTIPDKDAWVNLSPYEKDRIIPDALGQTEMGRQMLEQDYVLKQLASSLTNPDKELGQKFWNEVKVRAQKQFGTTDIPLNTFNKVWIIPDGATVVEKDGFAYITESKLKVMLDEDYGTQNLSSPHALSGDPLPKIDSRFRGNDIEKLSTQVFRDLILPKLIEEVNTGKNFAATRQVYQSVILAAWYKRALKDSLLGRIYADKSKIAGVETDIKDIKQKVYNQYLEAFKKGAYNVIKEEDGPDGELIPRKYFSGGENWVFPESGSSSLAVLNDTDHKLASAAIEELPQDQIVLVAAGGVENRDEMEAIGDSFYKRDINSANGLIEFVENDATDAFSHFDRDDKSGLSAFNSRGGHPLANKLFSGLLDFSKTEGQVFHALDTGAGAGFAFSDMYHIAQAMGVSVKFEVGGLTPIAPHYVWQKGMSMAGLQNLIFQYVQDHPDSSLVSLKKYVQDIREDNEFKKEKSGDISITDAVKWAVSQSHIRVPLELAVSLQEAGYDVFERLDDNAAPRQIIGRFSKAVSQMSANQNFIYDSLGGLYYTFKNAASVSEIKETWESLKRLLHPQGILFFSATDALTNAFEEAPDDFIIVKMVSDDKSMTMVFYKDSRHYQALTNILPGSNYSTRRNMIAVTVSNADNFINRFIAASAQVVQAQASAASAGVIALTPYLEVRRLAQEAFEKIEAQDPNNEWWNKDNNREQAKAVFIAIFEELNKQQQKGTVFNKDIVPSLNYAIAQKVILSLSGKVFVSQPVTQAQSANKSAAQLNEMQINANLSRFNEIIGHLGLGKVYSLTELKRGNAPLPINVTTWQTSLFPALTQIPKPQIWRLDTSLLARASDLFVYLKSKMDWKINEDEQKLFEINIADLRAYVKSFEGVDDEQLSSYMLLMGFQKNGENFIWKDTVPGFNSQVLMRGMNIYSMTETAIAAVRESLSEPFGEGVLVDKLGQSWVENQNFAFGAIELAQAEAIETAKRMVVYLGLNATDDGHYRYAGNLEQFDQSLKDRGILSASSTVGDAKTVSALAAVSTPVAPGGIDFDPSKLNLQIKRDGHGVPLPLPQQDLENINIKGLYPVILNILPVNAQTLPILGQLNDSPPPAVVSKV